MTATQIKIIIMRSHEQFNCTMDKMNINKLSRRKTNEMDMIYSLEHDE